MVGFIGPDGVGKSSLFSLIAGARAIQAGKVEVLGGDMAAAEHRRRVCPKIAYMPQGLGKNLYPTLSVFETRLLRTPVWPRAERAGATYRSVAVRNGTHPFHRPAGGQALRRHETETGTLLRPDPRPRPADPGRADDRRRPTFPPAVLGTHRPHPRRATRHERDGGDRVHGGGRPLRLAGGP